MDPHGNIYRSAEPSPEDKARFDGYLQGRAEEGEKHIAALKSARSAWAALGDYRAEYERIAGIAAESPSQPVPQPPTPAPQPPPPGA